LTDSRARIRACEHARSMSTGPQGGPSPFLTAPKGSGHQGNRAGCPPSGHGSSYLVASLRAPSHAARAGRIRQGETNPEFGVQPGSVSGFRSNSEHNPAFDGEPGPPFPGCARIARRIRNSARRRDVFPDLLRPPDPIGGPYPRAPFTDLRVAPHPQTSSASPVHGPHPQTPPAGPVRQPQPRPSWSRLFRRPRPTAPSACLGFGPVRRARSTGSTLAPVSGTHRGALASELQKMVRGRLASF